MPRYIPLSTQQHREHGWLKNPDYLFAADRPVAELVAEEIPRALPTLPLAFLPEGDEWVMVALLSLDSHRNLFIHPDGRWLGGYIPAAFRGYPFALLKDTASSRRVLGFDDDSGLRIERPDSQQRFFTSEGELNAPVQQILSFLQQVDDQRQTTRRAVQTLVDAGVVAPWKITVKSEQQNDRRVEGLHRIDETALKALPGDTLGELAASGALSIAYAQLFAQHRLSGLTRLVELHAKFDEQRQAGESVDVERLFDNDDDISFNFDE